MNDAVIPLAAGFSPATRGDWLTLVERTLKGASIDTLISRTADGLALSPLYTGEDADGPTALERPRPGDRPWDIRDAARHPQPARANAEILASLAGGAASVLLKIDPSGADGVALGSAADLAAVLDGVMTEIAPVALDAGFLGVAAADWLHAVAKSAPAASLALHLDPLSAFARAGVSPGPIEAHLIAAAGAAVRLAEPYPKASLFLASGAVAHEAGASEAQELAFMAAAAAAYAKALVRAGMPIEAAFSRLVLGLATDADYFVSIAKLRAARLMWAHITAACGVTAPAVIEARSSRRMLTKAEPWTNLIRLTAAGFAAAVGGADAVVLGAFTDAMGLPTAFARRQARNTQLVLMEEAALGRVIDPAAGAWFVEGLTRDLAACAWAKFQAIEAAGGLATALASGAIAADIALARQGLADRLVRGDSKLIGVTVFKSGEDHAIELEAAAPSAVVAPDPRLPGPDSACPPLTPVRLEALVT